MNPMEQVVCGDTVEIVSDIIDRITGEAADLSSVLTVVKLRVRKVGDPAIKGEVVCTKLPGLTKKNGSITVAAPYDLAGFGGRCVGICPVGWFAEAGDYQAETTVEYGETDEVLTVYDLLQVVARARL
ncbi:hypothetical protein [Methylibium sp.]|uniref:hypothetical protein n=1 Tax=Methylibium sp. TaxID=2067992 RepID=UPI003D0DD7C6